VSDGCADPVTDQLAMLFNICTLRILSAYCVKRVGSCAWGIVALFIGGTTLTTRGPPSKIRPRSTRVSSVGGRG